MEQKRVDRITRVMNQRQRDIVVVLEDIHDPHNAAAILRTCDAMGIQNVWFIFEKEAVYNPKRIGKATSSSANKWLDFKTFGSSNTCIDTLKRKGYDIVVTALTDVSVTLLKYRISDKKIALFVGNEHSGVSKTALTVADAVIQIPMFGFVQSLNVSVATAIVLWEMTRQRRASKNDWRLVPGEQRKLLRDFLKRAGK